MTQPPMILLVEDNELSMELESYLLEAAGFTVAPAVDAESARAALHGPPAALILMDMDLPGVDGLTLVKEIRLIPALASVPVIAVTAHAMRGDRERFVAGGCDGYISKPIDAPTFAQTVRDLLARGRAGDEGKTADGKGGA